MAGDLSLCDLPGDLSARYLPYTPTLRQKQRATAFVKASYLKSLSISSVDNEGTLNLFARIYRSQRKSEEPHKTSLDVDTKGKLISDAYCSCKAGLGGRCSHVLAVIFMVEEWKIAGYKDVPSQSSSTSLPQQWDKPRGPKIKPEPVSQIIISRPGNLNRKRRPIMANFQDNRKHKVSKAGIEHLASLKKSPISYLVGMETCTPDDRPDDVHPVGCPLAYHAPLMQTTIQPRNANADECGNIHFPLQTHSSLSSELLSPEKRVEWKDLEIDEKTALDIERKSRNDRQMWMNERKLRITASNFGHIMIRKKDFNKSFMKNTFDKKQFTSAPTSYGIANESIAKQMYIKRTGNHLHDIGLVVNPLFSFLGATPDSIVCDGGFSGIVEIKCPFSVRDLSISEACKTRPDFFLEQQGEYFHLSKTHIHWYQVQGQLLVTGAPFCDFVTFTRQDLYIERIYPEVDTMERLLSKLSDFYIDHFKPYFA